MTRRSRVTDSAVYEFVIAYHTKRGYGPSLREIMREVGLRSTATAHAAIERLVREGMLRKTPGIARSIRPA